MDGIAVVAKLTQAGEIGLGGLILLGVETGQAADRQDGQVVRLLGEECVRQGDDYVVLLPSQQDAAKFAEHGIAMRAAGQRPAVIPFCGVPPLQLVEGIPDQRDHLRDRIPLEDVPPETNGRIVLLAAVQEVHQPELEKQLVRLHVGEQGVLREGLGGIAALVVAVRELFQQVRPRPLLGHHLRQRRDRLVILP